jgi:hypothetical protein
MQVPDRRRQAAATDPPPTANVRAAQRQAERAREAEAEPGPLTSRNIVLAVLAAALGIGVGRKLVQGWRTRRALNRLSTTEGTPAEIEALAMHGRAALPVLFPLLDPATDVARRQAAGVALATLWARDELVAEEERAIVTRGYTVDWTARRTYPRGLRRPIPISVSFAVPFLGATDGCVQADQLEWSVRLKGTHRADLEQFTAWSHGPARLDFTIVPDDFAGLGPHTIVLEPRARPHGLSSAWEHALPQVPFRFEFSPSLQVAALLATHDEARAVRMARGVRLVSNREVEGDAPAYQPLSPNFAVRGSLWLEIDALPHDLAHPVWLEIEGLDGQLPASSIVAPQPADLRHDRGSFDPGDSRRYPVICLVSGESVLINRPGPARVRAVLKPDAELGWLDPAIRSIWPGEIITDWTEVEIARR